jgi:hypothetical protein
MSNKFKMPTRTVEEWVKADAPAEEPQEKPPVKASVEKGARLTIDLPVDLHARFKAACALNKTRMVDEVTRFIEDWTQKHS